MMTSRRMRLGKGSTLTSSRALTPLVATRILYLSPRMEFTTWMFSESSSTKSKTFLSTVLVIYIPFWGFTWAAHDGDFVQLGNRAVKIEGSNGGTQSIELGVGNDALEVLGEHGEGARGPCVAGFE